jgi:peptidoglycan/xylan/chitin deacetylase (PgdA/CDA1 family)
MAAQNAAIDRTLQSNPYVWEAGRQHREIALTFDDGPGPYTPQVLAVLEREDVPATFFEIGNQERYFGASTNQIVAHDFVIGDHTFTHPQLNTLSSGDQQAQIFNQTKAIARYGAPFPRLFRPPYGNWNSTTISLLHRYKMLMVLWTLDTNDWQRPGTQAIVHRVLAGARPGAIVLMHDGGGDRSETVAALPTIIKDLRQRGYRLVTVPQLLVDNPAPQNQHGYVLGGGG